MRDEQPSAALVPRPAESGVERQSDAALAPTRREIREVRGRRGLGRPVRVLLVFAVVACLGVFGYWGWTLYEGEPAGVREGSCIAALGGADVKPLNCTDARAKYTVLEVFKGASDPTTCAVVLGATDPMVVHRDGRTDVWCVAPNARAGNG
ncbi:LppU/SCO3897 family protein [Yinghuangia sp. YIM S09857]|uniref:LppU/SCO3897 family protein n=1 Tax=Yinghuangia sp. YIM S09857 TaxID=3436929 RepID=UPI003F53814E